MSRRKALALAMTACATVGSATIASAATGGAPVWAATHTQALSLHSPRLGAAPSNKQLRISLTLGLRNKPAMNALVQTLSNPASPSYQHFLTPAQVLSRFGPSKASVDAATHYLAQQGFTNIDVAPNHLLIDATGTVARAERAFHTSISLFRFNGHTIYANTSTAMVPAALGKSVTAVLGLSDVPMQTPKLATTAAGSPDLTGFSPQAVTHAYDADKMKKATGTSVAVVAAGDLTGVLKNLRTAESKWHLPRVPVTPVYGSGKAIDTTDNPLAGSVEWDLDTQMATMIPGAVKRLYIYDVATFTDPEVARAFNLFVSQDKAVGLSASLGECDYIAFIDGAMLTTDEALAEGALQGQSSFASTGDNGYACPEGASTGVPEGPPGVSWPSSGEYTTAVGGTTLVADDKGNVSEEIAWSGGGGGISPWETAAPWTLRANPAGQSWQFTNQGGRGVPDVAAVADSTTPVLVYAGGSTPEGVGGTSVSSPVVLGLWARIQGANNNKLGLSSFDFYRLYNKVNPGTVTVVAGEIPVYTPQPNPAPVPGFRDITVGTNGVYPATPGYDYTTGIGVLDAAKLAKLL